MSVNGHVLESVADTDPPVASTAEHLAVLGLAHSVCAPPTVLEVGWHDSAAEHLSPDIRAALGQCKGVLFAAQDWPTVSFGW